MSLEFHAKEAGVPQIKDGNLIIPNVKGPRGSRDNVEETIVLRSVTEKFLRELGDMIGEFWHDKADATSKE